MKKKAAVCTPGGTPTPETESCGNFDVGLSSLENTDRLSSPVQAPSQGYFALAAQAASDGRDRQEVNKQVSQIRWCQGLGQSVAVTRSRGLAHRRRMHGASGTLGTQTGRTGLPRPLESSRRSARADSSHAMMCPCDPAQMTQSPRCCPPPRSS